MWGFEFVAKLVLAVVAAYYTTTLAVWFGHWFAHKPRSPTRGFHMLGHHALYPSSKKTRHSGDVYVSGEGRTNSAYSLLPWLCVELLGAALVLPWPWTLFFLGEMVMLLVIINHVHEQFHAQKSWLWRFAWFRLARDRHDIHHDRPRNFMVADHIWDRCFRTFEPARERSME